jgi:hypothetical protein
VVLVERGMVDVFGTDLKSEDGSVSLFKEG